MMIPYQQDINKTINVLETKLNSIELLKGPQLPQQSSLFSLKFEKEIESKFEELRKEFNAKIEEQRNQICQLINNQKANENKKSNNEDNSLLKVIEEIRSNIKNIINEIKGIKEGNYEELKSLNTKNLKVIDFEQVLKCDFKTLNSLDLFQLKLLSEGKSLNSLNNQLMSTKDDDKLKEINDIIPDMNKKVNESIEVGTMIKKLKLNEKLPEINSQLAQFHSQINDIKLKIDEIKSTSSMNKPSSGIAFDEMNKINQQIIGLKHQVNGMQSKQSFFIEASALEAVSSELKKKINSTDYYDTVSQLKKNNKELNNEMADFKAQMKEFQRKPLPLNSSSLDQEKENIMNVINAKFALFPNHEIFDEEAKKIAQLENRIFILETAENELGSIYAQKDDIKFLLDEIDKVNDKINENSNKQIQMPISEIPDLLLDKPSYHKEVNQPLMLTNLPIDQEKPIITKNQTQSKRSPFAMAEKNDLLENYIVNNELTIEKPQEPESNIGLKTINDILKDSQPKKKEHDPDDFDDFDVDEIEDLK